MQSSCHELVADFKPRAHHLRRREARPWVRRRPGSLGRAQVFPKIPTRVAGPGASMVDIARLEALLVAAARGAAQPDLRRGARPLRHQDHAAPGVRTLPRPRRSVRAQPCARRAGSSRCWWCASPTACPAKVSSTACGGRAPTTPSDRPCGPGVHPARDRTRVRALGRAARLKHQLNSHPGSSIADHAALMRRRSRRIALRTTR
jgi:hypothetical protein